MRQKHKAVGLVEIVRDFCYIILVTCIEVPSADQCGISLSTSSFVQNCRKSQLAKWMRNKINIPFITALVCYTTTSNEIIFCILGLRAKAA